MKRSFSLVLASGLLVACSDSTRVIDANGDGAETTVDQSITPANPPAMDRPATPSQLSMTNGSSMTVNEGPMTDPDLAMPDPPAPAQEPPAAKPVYVLGSGVSGPDGETTYFTALSAIGSDVTVDYQSSLENAGVGRLYGAEGAGFFALGSEESMQITRYEVSDAGAFAKGSSVSLQGAGVTAMVEPPGVAFVSPTKAYFLDGSQLQVLVWNPSDMTLRGNISLAELVKQGNLTILSTRPVVRGNQLVFAAGWQDEDASGVQPGMALITIDTQTDALTIQPADDRCRDPGELTLAADGTIYAFSNYTNAMGKLGTGNGGDDCVLRVLPGANQFDPDYVGSISSAVGGSVAVGVVQRDAQTLWALVLDEELANFTPGGITFDEFFGTAAWRWAKLDFPSLTNPSIDMDRAPTTYNSAYFRVDGKLYISEATADFANTTLLDVSGDQPVPSLTFPGYLTNLLRVH